MKNQSIENSTNISNNKERNMSRDKDSIFNIPLMNDEELKELVGTTINCIDLTPFTALSGMMIGYMNLEEDSDTPIKNMILLVDKNYETTEELKDFVIDWSDLFGEEVDAVLPLLEIQKDGINLHIDEEYFFIDAMITKNILETKKVFLVPFTHCSADAF